MVLFNPREGWAQTCTTGTWESTLASFCQRKRAHEGLYTCTFPCPSSPTPLSQQWGSLSGPASAPQAPRLSLSLRPWRGTEPADAPFSSVAPVCDYAVPPCVTMQSLRQIIPPQVCTSAVLPCSGSLPLPLGLPHRPLFLFLLRLWPPLLPLAGSVPRRLHLSLCITPGLPPFLLPVTVPISLHRLSPGSPAL